MPASPRRPSCPPSQTGLPTSACAPGTWPFFLGAEPCCLCCGAPACDSGPGRGEAQEGEVGLREERKTHSSKMFRHFSCNTEQEAVFSATGVPSALGSLRWGAVPWLRGLRVGLVALWCPKLCEPTVLPSVEKGLLGRGRWHKPLPATGEPVSVGGAERTKQAEDRKRRQEGCFLLEEEAAGGSFQAEGIARLFPSKRPKAG